MSDDKSYEMKYYWEENSDCSMLIKDTKTDKFIAEVYDVETAILITTLLNESLK